jgi:hypothetical protein
MEELIKQVETSLEENVLRHQLPLKEAFNLGWCSRKDLNKGSSECTILAHVLVETNLASLYNKRHLH